MIHHSLTKDGVTVSWPAIRHYHVETNGWLDIGYHYGIELIEDSIEVLIGRPESMKAAACPQGDMNSKAIHVCCVGNFDEAPPSQKLIEVLCDRLLIPLVNRFELVPERIVGHRDYDPWKSCPGLMFSMETVRERIFNR